MVKFLVVPQIRLVKFRYDELTNHFLSFLTCFLSLDFRLRSYLLRKNVSYWSDDQKYSSVHDTASAPESSNFIHQSVFIRSQKL